jgi:hypothetical protein
MPLEAVASYTALSVDILEPIRAHFNEAMIITSGYLIPAANAAANGVPNSQHMATADYCAADWYVASIQTDMRPVFDWIRTIRRK